jgi:hypothetical protein
MRWHTLAAASCALAAVANLALAWWVVFDRHFGRVVAVLSAREGWGIHTGDAWGVAALATAVALAAAAVALAASGRRRAPGR